MHKFRRIKWFLLSTNMLVSKRRMLESSPRPSRQNEQDPMLRRNLGRNRNIFSRGVMSSHNAIVNINGISGRRVGNTFVPFELRRYATRQEEASMGSMSIRIPQLTEASYRAPPVLPGTGDELYRPNEGIIAKARSQTFYKLNPEEQNVPVDVKHNDVLLRLSEPFAQYDSVFRPFIK
ncbi:uncharacterized protein LOC117169621 [Belonocnema kinseyi]|uniref:uncharacterized protein LOC117169621 n=1 Tax=Belonocnema kinseyi TaxID=2817044 RepID=UPI00143D5A5B|nr:uncharacterized protein LOC117169621 [Belonocnema kinseyi]XP_033211967.1 uncharacterized protein LOC117169621 [Belonocnema kinseyi]